MKKERIETYSAWMEIKISGARTDCVYGFRDDANIHGHTALSGSKIVYQRNISGAELILLENSFFMSGANIQLVGSRV
mgnify:CR=1 FL=1